MQNRPHAIRRKTPPPSANLSRPCAVVYPQKVDITSLTERFLEVTAFLLSFSAASLTICCSDIITI